MSDGYLKDFVLFYHHAFSCICCNGDEMRTPFVIALHVARTVAFSDIIAFSPLPLSCSASAPRQAAHRPSLWCRYAPSTSANKNKKAARCTWLLGVILGVTIVHQLQRKTRPQAQALTHSLKFLPLSFTLSLHHCLLPHTLLCRHQLR